MATIPETLAVAVKHHRAGEVQRAEQLYQEVLRVDPNQADALHLLGVIAHQEGKHQHAVEQIRRAIASNPNAAAFHSNLGSAYDALRRLDDAAASYRRALEIKPEFAQAHNNLGNALKEQGKLDEAVASYQRALKIKPDYAEAHNNLGTAWRRQGKLDEAMASYRRALRINPDYVEALANMAALDERLNRVPEATSTVAKCLAASPGHLHANLVASRCEEREGRYREAIDRLASLYPLPEADPDIAREISFQLGRLYDRVGDSSRAFARLVEANRLAMQRTRDCTAHKQRYLQKVDTLSEVFSQAWVDSWLPAPPFDGDETPVFLIGFPRSGTTLLDVVLDSHPRIQTLDEKPTVLAIEQAVGALPGGYPGAMSDLVPAQIEQLRAAYFRAVDDAVDRQPGQILVDKLPLNMVDAGLILRVFPAARFIVTVRHPCDVCLSCFMQNFKINRAMANFFTLEDAALLYAKVMGLWRQYVRVLPHPYHLVRYEDLVEDFEAETRRLLQFLNVDWDDAILAYREHARRRGMINTTSYHQVIEPIYTRARYRWQRYAEQLGPVIGALKPYIKRFGYRDSGSSSGGRSVKSDTSGISELLAVAMKHHQAGELPRAEQIYREVLEADPKQPDALHLLGVIAHQGGRHEAAVDYIRRAIESNSLAMAYHSNLGLAYQALGKLAEAVGSYEQALRINPRYAEAHYNLGNALKDQGELDEAVAGYERAVRIKPDYAEAYNNLGVALADQGKHAEAAARFQQALQIEPEFAEACHNLANALREQEQYDAAIAHYRRVLEANPEHADAYFNLGLALGKQAKLADAVAAYEQALQIKPGFAKAHNNLGNVLENQGAFDEGIASYGRALQIEPDYALAHLNRSIARLRIGDFENGWDEYEWRWENERRRPQFIEPAWDGSPLAGRRILVHGEQGLGDEIMFASCIPEIVNQAAECVVECNPRLVSLFARSFPLARVGPRVMDCDPDPGAVSRGVDVQIMMGSLPRYLRRTLDSFPQPSSYLAADPQLHEKWRGRLAELGEGLKVGISWRGGKDRQIRIKRSTRLDQWAPVFAVPGVHFIDLQYDDCPDELAKVRQRLGVDIHDWEDSDRRGDLDGMAAEISALDLVISVDNSTVHMAGALGTAVWALLPAFAEWRWLLGREDSIWYPRVRLFRQTRLDRWEDVFERVAQALREHVGKSVTGRPTEGRSR